jgi:PucR C-terminal helix-turn-helix domain/GGDEF-like domain
MAAVALADRLAARRAEIEAAMLARVHAVSDPGEIADPEYALGLREAVGAALDYGIAATQAPRREPAPIPDRLLAQARAAARNRVSLETVLRRYSAGYALLDDFLIRAAEDGNPVSSAELKRALRSLSAVFDRLAASISEEYGRESERRSSTSAHRRVELVRKLLAGEQLDIEELNYGLGAWHLALLASGPGAPGAIRDLATALDRNLLLVQPEDGEAWAWLGGRSRLSTREVLRLAERSLPGEVSLAFGEPGQGAEGWRLSHRQAKAAMAVARRGAERRLRYADVALLASALRDDVLASWLHDIYLVPLKEERDGGVAQRETLEAYFMAGRNASSAAAALRVSRQTVNSRLRSVEECIGRPLDDCAAELETALRLDGLSNRQVR